MPMDLILGGPARGEDFCFRREFLQDLWDALKKNHVLLVGPRRMGKTSIMYHMVDHPAQDVSAIYLNVEAVATPADFVIALILALRESQPVYFYEKLGMIWGLYKNLIRHITTPEVNELKRLLKEEFDWVRHWQDPAGQLFQGMKKIGQPVVFMIDELPDMLLRIGSHDPAQLETFLTWFRSVRQNPDSPVRWLVAGSTNLIGTLERFGHAKLIGDFYHLDLPPFSLQEAENFCIKVFTEKAIDFESDAIPAVQEVLGKPIPFFLQLLVKELIGQVRGGATLNRQTVRMVCEKVLLGDQALGHLQHFYSRIDPYYPEEDREAVRDLLGFLSLSKGGVPMKMLFERYKKFETQKKQQRDERRLTHSFSRLLLLLQTDFYVEDAGDRRYDFSNRLVKSWWSKYYPAE
jgi:hypothetical protein